MPKKTNKKSSFLRTSYFRLRRGFTLLEVIIAVSLIMIGLTATLFLITKTVSQMSVFPSELIAAYLTQEGIEIVRNIRDTNWLEQKVDLSNPWDEGLVPPDIDCSVTSCRADYTATTTTNPPHPTFSTVGGGIVATLKFDSSSGFYNYTSGDLSKFARSIKIVPVDLDLPLDGVNDVLEVTVTVTWSEKGEPYSHTAQEKLYNWK